MWVLILISATWNNSGRSIDHIEFTSKERCISAQQFSSKRESILDAYCVPK